jgi:Spy/CpxP family protein refolding chaperone
MKLIRPMIITGLLLSALPAFADTTVTAQVSKDGGKACAGKCVGGKFQLTPEQRAKLGSLRDQLILSTADKKAELKVAHNQMRSLFSQPTIDKQAVLTLETKINGLKDDLSNARINMILASTDVFTPEQRAEFVKMHGQGGWRHHRGGHEGFRGHSERSIG